MNLLPSHSSSAPPRLRVSHLLQASIPKAQRCIELCQERRTALISAAVTGKIDVREISRGGAENAEKTK